MQGVGIGMNLEPGIRRSSLQPLTATPHNPHSQRELAVHAAPTRTTSLPLHKLDAARTSRVACVRSPRRGAERVTWESMSARTPTPGGSSSRAPAVGKGCSGGGQITGGACTQRIGEGAPCCSGRLVFAQAVGLEWCPRGRIPSRRFTNRWEQLR